MSTGIFTPGAAACWENTSITWVACFKSLGLRALIGNCFWPSGAFARRLTDRKSTSNRNDLARAVSIHQVPEFQILGLKIYRGVSASTVYSMVSLAFDQIILPVSFSPTTDPLHPALPPPSESELGTTALHLILSPSLVAL